MNDALFSPIDKLKRKYCTQHDKIVSFGKAQTAQECANSVQDRLRSDELDVKFFFVSNWGLSEPKANITTCAICRGTTYKNQTEYSDVLTKLVGIPRKLDIEVFRLHRYADIDGDNYADEVPEPTV
jgi:hypothetical protein